MAVENKNDAGLTSCDDFAIAVPLIADLNLLKYRAFLNHGLGNGGDWRAKILRTRRLLPYKYDTRPPFRSDLPQYFR